MRDNCPLLVWCSEDEVMLNRNHRISSVMCFADRVAVTTADCHCDDVFVNATTDRLFAMYSMWTAGDLRELAHAHEIGVVATDGGRSLRQKIWDHVCGDACATIVIHFTTLRGPRSMERVEQARAAMSSSGRHSFGEDSSFMAIADAELYRAI